MEDKILIRDAEKEDMLYIEEILQQWVHDSETGQILTKEIEEIVNAVSESIDAFDDVLFVVAEVNEKVVGIMGLRLFLDENMLDFASTDSPAELVNAYVDSEFSGGHGIGRKLLEELECRAANMNSTEILVNSGPRYKESGWGFYSKVYGEPVGQLENRYGQGRHAPVWRKIL